MRILVLSNLYPPYYIGGYELRCQETVDELRKRGHSVLVLTSTYGVRRPVTEGHILRQLLIYRYGLARVLSTGKLRLIYTEWWNTRRLIHLVESFSPDIVFIWNLRGLSMSLLATAQRLGVPLVYSVGDTWLIDVVREDDWFNLWNCAPENALRAITKRALQKCGLRRIIDRYIPTDLYRLDSSNMFFISEDLKRLYLEEGVNVWESPVIYRGVDIVRFNMRTKKTLAFPVKLLFCGRLSPDKGAHLAIEAVSHLVNRGYKELQLDIVGEGSEEYNQYLGNLVAQKGMNLYVNFLGKIAHAQLPKVYNSHDIFLFASTWRGVSVTIMEAMACGVVVVGARVSGSHEIFKDGVNCLTFEPGNAIDLADKIETLIHSPQLWAKLREAGRKTVVERFSLKTMVDKIEEFLYRVVDAHRC